MTAVTPVLIAGGGPVGLVLALELEHRGIDAILVERNETTTRHPKMDLTNGRSMELLRRLGVVEALRSRAVPAENPMHVVWCTRAAGWELARFEYPSVAEAYEQIGSAPTGHRSVEPGMRISQIVFEPTIREAVEAGSHIDVRFGTALESFEQTADGVTAVVVGQDGNRETIEAQYLIGCDGSRSVVRKGLGIGLDELSPKDIMRLSRRGIARSLLSALRGALRGQRPPSGKLYMVHFESPESDFLGRFGPAWHLQSPLHGTIISQNDRDTWTLHVPLPGGIDPDAIDPRAFLFEHLGR